MRYQADEIVNCLGDFLPNSSGVYLRCYDIATRSQVPTTDSGCLQIEDTGVFKWPTSYLQSQPAGYTEYLYIMRAKDTGLEHRGKFVLHGYEERHGYQGAVWLDVANGSSGTAYPLGTAADPVNNIGQARTIADNYGYRTYHIRGDIALSGVYDDWQFLGWGQSANDIIDINSQYIDGSYFERMTLTGVAMPGDTFDADNCLLKGIEGLHGTYNSCYFEGDLVLQSGLTTSLNTAFKENTCLDFNVSGAIGHFNACSGDVTIKNMTDSLNDAVLSFISGEVTVENTCTDGTIHIHGIINVTDDSGAGCIVDRDAQLPYATFQSDLSIYTMEGTAGHTLFMTAYRGEVWVNTTGKEISSVSAKQARFMVEGSYFTFQGIDNDGTTYDYYVWFKIDSVGSDPAPGGTGFLVELIGGTLPAGDDEEEVAAKIYAAITGNDGFWAKLPIDQLYDQKTVVITSEGSGVVDNINQQDSTLRCTTIWNGADNVGFTGTDFPVGTPYKPVDNITDAKAIAELIGTVRYSLLGTLTLDQEINYTMWRSQTDDYQGAIIDINGYATYNTHFSWLTMTGTMLDTPCTAENCWMENLFDVNILFRNGQLYGAISVGFQLKGTGVACPNVLGMTINLQNQINQTALVDFNGVATFANSTGGSILAVTGFYKLGLSAVGTSGNPISILYLGGIGTVDYPGNFNPQSVATWVDITLPGKVWDELWTEHLVAGTFGEVFSLIIGYLVSTLNPVITAIDGNVDSILADTDTLEADLKTYMDTIQASIEAIVNSIQSDTTGILSDTDIIKTVIARILGLVHENIVVENTFDETGRHTGYIAYIYDSKTNADLHDKSTGLLYTFTMTVIYDEDGNPTTVKVVKN